MVAHEGKVCNCIDLVFHVYHDSSIKELEGVEQASVMGTTSEAITSGHKIKQWKEFLFSPENKNKLIYFLANDWITSVQ